MKPLTFTDEFQQYLKANEGVTALVMYLPQIERGVTMTLHPSDVALMDEEPHMFCERFIVPAIGQLSEELKVRK